MTKLRLLSKTNLFQKVKKKKKTENLILEGEDCFFRENQGVETDGKRENVAHPTSLMSGQGY